ncbi:hypothetical protein PR003_g7293 [Phytophthora rubi]|uniref:Uncharacterized protein n=1 Tax=Phytophthora rubi TaxID=129364 RepID=A0A6A4FEB1_9STRA|nr:hypothetical protein PR003_g7293 [Phytophthora rubi]
MRKPVAASTRADETIARELEVRFSRMLPLLSCLDDTAVHTDYIDQSRRRAGVVVFCRDLQRLNETYQTARDSPLWGELEKPHGQPIRMEIEHSFTTTLHADMHRCFRNEIAQILTYARAKGAMCQESQSKAFASDAVASKNMVTLKFLGEMAVLQRVKAKFEESMFCEKVESSELHLLFSVSGRYKISDWMDKHIEDDTTQVRYFIRWIKKTREFWVYGDVRSRAYATEALLQLANDIKDLEVLDKPVRLNSSKIQIKAWMEKAPTAQALFSYFVQSNRRIMVSGTNLQYSSLLQALDAEGLLFKNDLHDLGLNLPAHLQGQDDGTFSFDDEFETPEDLAVRRHVNKVHSDILNLKCPKCELVFVDFDFDSCAALTCANPVCKGGFCAYCLEDCGDDAHQHVSKCSLNPNKPYYYVTGEQFILVHKERRQKSVEAYIRNVREKEGVGIAQRLHSVIIDDLKRLGLDVALPQ